MNKKYFLQIVMITTINEQKIFSTNSYDYNHKWTQIIMITTIYEQKLFSTNSYDYNNKWTYNIFYK